MGELKALERLSGSNEVPLVFIPGHDGIPGKEEADKLARKRSM
jgi:ribonuclease HI